MIFSSELVIGDLSSSHCKREYLTNIWRGNCISTIVSRKFVETQGNACSSSLISKFVSHCYQSSFVYNTLLLYFRKYRRTSIVLLIAITYVELNKIILKYFKLTFTNRIYTPIYPLCRFSRWKKKKKEKGRNSEYMIDFVTCDHPRGHMVVMSLINILYRCYEFL